MVRESTDQSDVWGEEMQEGMVEGRATQMAGRWAALLAV